MPSATFTHQENANGGFDSICSRCVEIAASALREEQLSSSESMHVCDPVRLYQISQGRIPPPPPNVTKEHIQARLPRDILRLPVSRLRPERIERFAGGPSSGYRPTTFFRIVVARLTLSATAAKRRGLGRLMSSRARRTAQMMAAAMTRVEAKRSRWRSSFSRALARFISPTGLG